MLLTSYLARFKARIEVIKGAGGKPCHHNAAVRLVYEEIGLMGNALKAT